MQIGCLAGKQPQAGFLMSAPMEKQPDQKQIVALLAAESQLPLDDVALLYEHEHAALAIGAHITKFLHIFATRNVQEILRKRVIDKQAVLPLSRPLLPAKRLLMALTPPCSHAPNVVDKQPLP